MQTATIITVFLIVIGWMAVKIGRFIRDNQPTNNNMSDEYYNPEEEFWP